MCQFIFIMCRPTVLSSVLFRFVLSLECSAYLHISSPSLFSPRSLSFSPVLLCLGKRTLEGLFYDEVFYKTNDSEKVSVISTSMSKDFDYLLINVSHEGKVENLFNICYSALQFWHPPVIFDKRIIKVDRLSHLFSFEINYYHLVTVGLFFHETVYFFT